MRLLLFHITLVAIGCSLINPVNGQDIIVDKFPKERIISSAEVKIPPVLWAPKRMFVLDNHLFTLESRNDSIFKVFKLPEGELVHSFGKRGKGPNEIFSPNSNSFKPIHGGQPAMVFDGCGNGMNYYLLSDILSGDFSPYKNIPVPGIYNRNRGLAFLGDSVIIGAPYDEDMHLYLLNNAKSIDSAFVEYPLKMKNLSFQIKREMFGCYMAVKPDNSKIAITYTNEGKVEIYDFRSKKWLVIKYKDFPSLRKNLGLNKSNHPTKSGVERKVFSWEIRASNNYIFVKVYNTDYYNMSDGNGPIRTFIPQVHVFTWTGEPVAKLQPDRFYRWFDVDSEEKNLYAIDDYFEDVIIKFSLDGILQKLSKN